MYAILASPGVQLHATGAIVDPENAGKFPLEWDNGTVVHVSGSLDGARGNDGVPTVSPKDVMAVAWAVLPGYVGQRLGNYLNDGHGKISRDWDNRSAPYCFSRWMDVD
jgi:hypothetical protein